MNVLLTGATGFLGVHLLRELLAGPERATVTVLSRSSPDQVLDRLGLFLRGAGERELAEDLPTRVTAMRADLTRPRLGLTEAGFADLADSCDAVWHCAADTRLDRDLARLRCANVAGLRSVLELVLTGRRRPRLCHVSTAFVAGARRGGTVLPDDLDGTFGFENPYERTKFEGEQVVRDWACRHGRPAMVLRPSILVTDQPDRLGMPVMGYLAFARAFSSGRKAMLARGMRLPTDVRIRVTGDPRGHLNLLPVGLAAARMVRLSRCAPAGLVETHHVVHDHEVAVPTLVDVASRVLEETTSARLVLVPEPVTDPSRWEQLAHRLGPGVLSYLRHRRRYDDTSVRSLLGGTASGVRVDRDYLVAATGALGPVPALSGSGR